MSHWCRAEPESSVRLRRQRVGAHDLRSPLSIRLADAGGITRQALDRNHGLPGLAQGGVGNLAGLLDRLLYRPRLLLDLLEEALGLHWLADAHPQQRWCEDPQGSGGHDVRLTAPAAVSSPSTGVRGTALPMVFSGVLRVASNCVTTYSAPRSASAPP